MNLNRLLKQAKAGFAERSCKILYLYFFSIYVIFVFNEFLAKPVDFYALVLIIIGLPLINRANVKLIFTSIAGSKSAIVICLSILVISILFFTATLFQLPQTNGLIAFFAQYGVHIALPAIVLLVIPLNKESIRFIFNCLLAALIILALNDIALYIWQYLNFSKIGEDFSHRWFGDGYVFLYPFLLGHLLNATSEKDNRNQSQITHGGLYQLMLYLLLILIIFLAGGTGARSTYGIILLQITIFFYFKCRQLGLARASSILIVITFVYLLVNFILGFLAPKLYSGAIDRGLQIYDRIEHTWMPGIYFISKAPLLAYGFGVPAWNEAYALYSESYPNAINVGSTHNWFLATGFLGGVCAIFAQFMMTAGIIYWSFVGINNKNLEIKSWVWILLISFISFYLCKGLVEFTTYKYLSITLMGIFISNAVNHKHLHYKIGSNNEFISSKTKSLYF
ncbi:hypothetical protein [Polynucleobacter sp. KF022]|uniref:hypothetical protein n=1 Tax=Polynucleobacter sp. KF022 TaxID=2982615 RepID=UPI002491A3D9|nr:hypothetical protein [Polynucleobacter sp. KF022]